MNQETGSLHSNN